MTDKIITEAAIHEGKYIHVQTFAKCEGALNRVKLFDGLIDTTEDQIRLALIALGWTPPEDSQN